MSLIVLERFVLKLDLGRVFFFKEGGETKEMT